MHKQNCRDVLTWFLFSDTNKSNSGHHLVNQQHNNMQNSGGPSLSNSQQMQERHSQIVSNQPSSEPGSNARMDNNPKKRMLSQQQHQMVSQQNVPLFALNLVHNSNQFEKIAISTDAASSRACTNSATWTTRSTNSNSSDKRKFYQKFPFSLPPRQKCYHLKIKRKKS